MTIVLISLGLYVTFAIVFFRQKCNKCALSSMTNFHYVTAVITDMKDVIMTALVVPRHPVLCQYLALCLRFPPAAQANKKLPGDSDIKLG